MMRRNSDRAAVLPVASALDHICHRNASDHPQKLLKRLFKYLFGGTVEQFLLIHILEVLDRIEVLQQPSYSH